jgi:hypothetical protein
VTRKREVVGPAALPDRQGISPRGARHQEQKFQKISNLRFSIVNLEFGLKN